MKRIIIVVFILGISAVTYMVLSNDSYEVVTNALQNVEQPFVSADNSRHIDPAGFSFEKVAGYDMRTLSDETGKTFLFEKEGKAATGFQMFVSYYDEPATDFTAARIRKDLPDLAMNNVKEFEIGAGRGVMFDSGSEREIWFVVGESLYQITAGMTDADAAEHIAATFKIE